MKIVTLRFSYFRNRKVYKLWNILHMRPGQERNDALLAFTKEHPVEFWRGNMYNILNKHLTCKKTEVFEKRIDRLSDLFQQDLKLSDIRELIQGCREFEKKMNKHRKPNEEGSFIFGTTDRIRILGDKLEEIYLQFRPLPLELAA